MWDTRVDKIGLDLWVAGTEEDKGMRKGTREIKERREGKERGNEKKGTDKRKKGTKSAEA